MNTTNFSFLPSFFDVMNAARDNNDMAVLAACFRVLKAVKNNRNWRQQDCDLVASFAPFS